MIVRGVRQLSKRIKLPASLFRPASTFSFAASSGDKPAPKLNLNLKDLSKKIKTQPAFDTSVNGQHYDVAVIGGGSGGLGFVLEAQKLGLKVVVFDYIDPTPHGTKWGLGGTCVNVGCIPKKLMHQASIHRESMIDAYDFGYDLGELNDPEDHHHEKLNATFEWKRLVRNIQLYIKSINFDYVSSLRENENSAYVNCLASFYDANTLVYTSQKSALDDYLATGNVDSEKMGKVTADNIIIAVGGRPTYLSEKACKNVKQHALTSDDIFSMKNPPKKTLVVGGGYIALECAGFLANMGFPVTLMNRTDVFLRGFDTDMTKLIMDNVTRNAGINVLPWTLPFEIEKEKEKLVTKFKNLQTQEESVDEFDTILMAVGRTTLTGLLNLHKVGVKTNEKNLKVLAGYNGEYERTNIDNIYALGDCLDGVPELTPIAQQSGKLLAHRLLLKKQGVTDPEAFEKFKMEYNDFPTTVFTPLEYSCIGYSEEKAIQVFGEANIQVYHSKFVPLEQALIMRNHHEDGESLQRKAYCKIICNKKDDERVVGIHYTGPNAGEVMQGYAVAIKLGMRKKDLERTVGIHPTTAEEFVVMTKTKAEDPEKTSC